MTNLLAIFATGLTTGGLSCLAVQGGLLASSVARQAEEEVHDELVLKTTMSRAEGYEEGLKELSHKKLPKQKYAKQLMRLKERYPLVEIATSEKPKRNAAEPIILFLAAKLVVYTLLGFLLGWLGGMLQLTPVMRGGLQLAIGIFMIGQAMRMFNVHPIFRYFVIEPPRFITRYIRRVAKNNDSEYATPLFLGALTVLIPCGITQGMMALAVGTGNPGLGAAIMFSFILGTSPIFFILSYLAAKLGEQMHERFLKFAAVVVLVLGLVSLEGGLNLVGSPISFTAIKDNLATSVVSQQRAAIKDALAQDGVVTGEQFSSMSTDSQTGNVVHIIADNSGYSPKHTTAKAGQPITLVVQSSNLYTCAQEMTFPKLGIQKNLPPDGTTTIQIPAQSAGTLTYTCSMGMYRGQISIN